MITIPASYTDDEVFRLTGTLPPDRIEKLLNEVAERECMRDMAAFSAGHVRDSFERLLNLLEADGHDLTDCKKTRAAIERVEEHIAGTLDQLVDVF